MSLRQNLESMLAAGQDNALLRFTLGNEYLKEGLAGIAVAHFGQEVECVVVQSDIVLAEAPIRIVGADSSP